MAQRLSELAEEAPGRLSTSMQVAKSPSDLSSSILPTEYLFIYHSRRRYFYLHPERHLNSSATRWEACCRWKTKSRRFLQDPDRTALLGGIAQNRDLVPRGQTTFLSSNVVTLPQEIRSAKLFWASLAIDFLEWHRMSSRV